MTHMKKHLTIERAVEAIIAIFALSGVANAAEYLSAHHNQLTAYGLSIALGGVLVACSVMLARTDWERERGVFWAMLAATLGALALTSAVQTLAYHEEYGIYQALLFGVGFPAIAECVLPVATSIFIAARRRRMIAEIDDHAERQVTQAIADSMVDLDDYIDKSRQYVGRQIDKLVRAKIDNVVGRMLPEIDAEAPELPKSDSVPDAAPQGLDKANQTRKQAKREAIDRMLSIYSVNPHASLREVGERIDRSAETVRGYLTELEEVGRIHRNGNGVEILG